MKKILSCLFFLVSTCAITSASANEFRILTHNSKNQIKIVDGIYHGIKKAGKRAFYVELVKVLLRKTNHPVTIENIAFPRGLVWVQTEDNIIFFAVQRTESREETVKWVGPISTGSDYFFEWKSRPTKITKIEDATNLRVCVLRKSVHDDFLSKKGFARLLRHSNYTTCFNMLKHGRVDLAISSPDTYEDKLKATETPLEKVQSTGVIVLEGSIYIAFSKNIPDQEIEKWNNALAEIKRSGVYQELLGRYLP